MTSIKIIWFFLIKKERVRSDKKGEKGHFIDYYVIKNDIQGKSIIAHLTGVSKDDFITALEEYKIIDMQEYIECEEIKQELVEVTTH